MKKILVIALASAASTALAAEFDVSAANGIARIISQSDRCGITVDQGGMDAYLAKSGLATAPALGHIASSVNLADGFGDDATDAECTAIRSTAKAIGVSR